MLTKPTGELSTSNYQCVGLTFSLAGCAMVDRRQRNAALEIADRHNPRYLDLRHRHIGGRDRPRRGAIFGKTIPVSGSRRAGSRSGTGYAGRNGAGCSAGGSSESIRGTAVERASGQFRPSADDRRSDHLGRGEFQQLHRRSMAGCGAARRDAGHFRHLHARTDTRPAHHGLDGCAARIHQGVLGLPGSSGQREPHQTRPRGAGAASRHFRCGGEGLRGRSPHCGGDLGDRIGLRYPGG